MNDPEAPAKNYQITELTNAVNNLVTTNERIERKIDDKLVTKERMEADLKLLVLSVQAVDDKYAPIKKSLSRVTWIVIGVVVPLLIISGIQLAANVIPGGSS